MRVLPKLGRNVPGDSFAHAGEKTYCERGHFIASFTQDVKIGEEGVPEHFDFAPGMTYGALGCPQCGATVAFEASDGMTGYFFAT